MTLTRLLLSGFLCTVIPATAGAAPIGGRACVAASAGAIAYGAAPADRIWNVDFGARTLRSDGADGAAGTTAQAAPRARAIEYSHGYEVRRKIHVAASVATLPLFVTQMILGQKIYDGSEGGAKTAHAAVATGIAALFGVNSVTGVWNLIESRKDPNHRTLRMTHGILMLAADAGFVATGLLAPDSSDPSFVDDRSTHRTVAYTSIGIATASYLLMLFNR